MIVSFSSTFSEKKIKIDNYLIPYALVELGLLFLDLDKVSDAAPLLEKAKYVAGEVWLCGWVSV